MPPKKSPKPKHVFSRAFIGIFLFTGLVSALLWGQPRFKSQWLSDKQNVVAQTQRYLGSALDKLVPDNHTTTLSPAPDLVVAARKQIGVTTGYDPAYVALDFPMGDVPIHTGVCTDVVIRAYREQGKDLQALVNADMRTVWAAYPKIWGLTKPDSNIDHRRVPNLQVFFQRHGKVLPINQHAADHKTGDYQAGDIVTWSLPPNSPHIGIVSNKATAEGVPLIIHNIGLGTQENNILFSYHITGHYRYE